MKYELKKISGDASFREFYRLKRNNQTSIIVLAQKEKFKNLAVYTVINNVLNNNRINAPKLISNHYKNSVIEISDLGENTLFDRVITKKNKLNSYKSIIKYLIKIQKIKVKKIYKFRNLKIKIPKYTLSNLHKESDLFFDWYLKYVLRNKRISKIKKILRFELNKVYKKLNYKNNTFVHRDFHISNIMINKNKLGIIDSQDAIIGNPLYDVASLIDDVRIKLTNKLQKNIFDFYHKNSKLKNDQIQKLKNDFDILSVQRNLKILGVFVRLYKRDNKENYLKFLPYTWTLIEKRLQNPVLKDLKLLLHKHLSIKKLKKFNKI
jgi:aminoglycoside/choline kinase family phosphotransferase